MKNNFMKTALVIGALLTFDNASAKGFYAGISAQKSGYNFKSNGKSPHSDEKFDYSSDEKFDYDDTASNYSAFLGYDFAKSAFTPYKLSLEISHFGDRNSKNTKYKVIDIDNESTSFADIRGDFKSDLISFNTINHYSLSDHTSIFAVAGINYVNMRFRESNTAIGSNISETEDSFGFNYGIGVSFKVPDMYNLVFDNKITIRAKIVHSTIKDLEPTNIESINSVDGITSISFDVKYNF